MKKIYEEVAVELGLDSVLVENTYKAFWSYIRNTIVSLPLKEDLTEEEFSKYSTNFNIPSLGKLSCTYDRFIGVKKRFNFIKKLKNNDKSKKC